MTDPAPSPAKPPANGTDAPAPKKTRAPRKPSTAGHKQVSGAVDETLQVVAFFEKAGQHELTRAVRDAIEAETEALFSFRNAQLKLRGDSAVRLRALAASEAARYYVRDIIAQINRPDGPDLDPYEVFRYRRAPMAWAVARVLMADSKSHDVFIKELGQLAVNL